MLCASLALDDGGFACSRRKVEIEGHEALPRAGLEVLEHALVTRVVRNDQLETGRRHQRFARLVDRENAAVVGQ